ncbi:MAG: TetR/AcrR family transcriptional regulator [Solirubrobacterales bacterium]|nr:TetR/AcrR family transcriptional regulator [Solirubrobacterales bacterium]
MVDGRIERGKATRERLIEAAREQFGAHGYEGTSLDAILGVAGVKRGALYHHFASKQELFDAVLDRVVGEMAERVANAAGAASDPVESLRIGCATWLRMALDPEVQRIVLLDPPSVVGWTRYREIDEAHTLGGLRHNLERIAAQGRLAGGDVDLLAHMVIASVNEAALMIARAKNPRAALKTGEATVTTLLDGLVRRAP